MAIFYPPPNPFIGAWQPLEPRKLTPPSVPVNNPPGYRLDGLLAQINQAWQVTWGTPPLPPLVQGAAAIVVQVPYTNQWLNTALQAWQPGPGLPLVGQRLTPPSVPVNNPPGYRIDSLLAQLNLAWQPGPPAQVLYPKQVQSVDNPPSYRLDSLLTQINGQWQVTWQPPLLAQLPQGTIAVVNNPPPYSIVTMMEVLGIDWAPAQPQPILPPLLTPPSGPIPPPPATGIVPGGVYPGNEWTGRREKKKDAALQTPEGQEVTPTVFAQRYLAARKKWQDKEDDELYTALLQFMMQQDDDED